MEYKQEEKSDVFSNDDHPPPHLSPSNMQHLSPAMQKMDTAHVPKLVLRNKLVVVGDPCVGKSAVCQMFHSGCQVSLSG